MKLELAFPATFTGSVVSKMAEVSTVSALNASNIDYLNDTQVSGIRLSSTEDWSGNSSMEATTTNVLLAASSTPSIGDTTMATELVTQATTMTSRFIANLTATNVPYYPYQLEPPMEGTKNETATTKTYHPEPGLVEFVIICGVIGIMLYVAAKYVGCKLSYFCCTCGEPKPGNELGTGDSRYVRRDNIFQRPEYERSLQYAVYSRPPTAHINHHIDARGYGFGPEDEEEDNVTFYSRTKDVFEPKSDLPPDYDTLVPPSYNTNYDYYTFNNPSGHSTSTATTTATRPATANPFLADSRL